jgi:hypothetical protein
MEAVPLTITLMKNYNYLVLAFMFQSQLSQTVFTLLRMPIEFDLFCKNPKDPSCLVVNALFDTAFKGIIAGIVLCIYMSLQDLLISFQIVQRDELSFLSKCC